MSVTPSEASVPSEFHPKFPITDCDVRARFPQMDVWPSCRFGRAQPLLAVRELNRIVLASGACLSKCTETSVSS